MARVLLGMPPSPQAAARVRMLFFREVTVALALGVGGGLWWNSWHNKQKARFAAQNEHFEKIRMSHRA